MKNTLWLMTLVLGISAYTGAADAGPKDGTYTGPVTDPGQVCMVKETVQPHTSYMYLYEGKTYHFCCTMCLSKFKADPVHLRLATDPVNGKSVDRADARIYSYKGHAYFFASRRTYKKFAKKPEKYLPRT